MCTFWSKQDDSQVSAKIHDSGTGRNLLAHRVALTGREAALRALMYSLREFDIYPAVFDIPLRGSIYPLAADD